MALHEYDKGIKYFRKHLPKWNPEVDLYRLLQILYGHTDDNPQLSETWIEIYDKAVERGIAPRQQLAEMREEIQEELAARDR
ncbi:MAG: hypothetical protein FWE94_07785 [Coriobacteriia bacterium]|nr:hypothetical protein [Coriobacteriia bacterium]